MKKTIYYIIFVYLCLSFSSCTNNDEKEIGEIPPVDATYLLYFSRENNNIVNELKTIKLKDHYVDYYVGKIAITKDQYKMDILVDNEVISSSSNNPWFELIVDQNLHNEKHIKAIFHFFPDKGEAEYKITYKMRCPLIFGDNEFHEINIIGDYALKENNTGERDRIFTTKEAYYMDKQKLEIRHIPINNDMFETEIHIPIITNTTTVQGIK